MQIEHKLINSTIAVADATLIGTEAITAATEKTKIA